MQSRVILSLIVTFIAMIMIAPVVSGFTINGYVSNPARDYAITHNGGHDEGAPYYHATGFNRYDAAFNDTTIYIEMQNPLFGDPRFYFDQHNDHFVYITFDNMLHYKNYNGTIYYPLPWNNSYVIEMIPEDGINIEMAFEYYQHYAIVVSRPGYGNETNNTSFGPGTFNLGALGYGLVAFMAVIGYALVACWMITRNWFQFDIFMIGMSVGLGVMVWVSVFPIYALILVATLLALTVYHHGG